MRIREVLLQGSRALSSCGIEDPDLEAELLLRHTLGIDRARLYLESDEELPPDKVEGFHVLLGRRLEHEPAAYITNSREFFGLELYVDPRVLIPRPESELLVEKALERKPGLICDVGTGSGAIAVALAMGLPNARVYAIDISPDALEVAAMNCRRHGVADRVHLLCGDMLTPLPEPVDLIVANPPYVKDSDMGGLGAEIKMFEPHVALSGGPDGMEKVAQLLSQANGRVLPNGSILIEIGEGQGMKATALARERFTDARVELSRDLSGIERVVSISLDMGQYP